MIEYTLQFLYDRPEEPFGLMLRISDPPEQAEFQKRFFQGVTSTQPLLWLEATADLDTVLDFLGRTYDEALDKQPQVGRMAWSRRTNPQHHRELDTWQQFYARLARGERPRAIHLRIVEDH